MCTNVLKICQGRNTIIMLETPKTTTDILNIAVSFSSLHSSLTSTCHQLTVKLIAGLSGFENTSVVWKKDVFDHMLKDNFFAMNESLLERYLRM